MKKLLIILGLLIAVSVTGQVTPKTPFNIPDNNTAFGINLPEGSYIYDTATDSVWVLNAVATTTTTLRTATKTLIASSSSVEIWTTDNDTIELVDTTNYVKTKQFISNAVDNRGDGNVTGGALNSTDALWIKQYIVGSLSPSNDFISRMDFDGDYKVTSYDAIGIANKYTGNDTRYEGKRAGLTMYGMCDLNLDEEISTNIYTPEIRGIYKLGINDPYIEWLFNKSSDTTTFLTLVPGSRSGSYIPVLANIPASIPINDTTLFQKYSDTTTFDATRYWVEEQGFLITEADGVVGNEGDTTKHHTVGYGLDGTFYNQTANQTWKADTNELTTPYYVKDAIHDSLTSLSLDDLSDVELTTPDAFDLLAKDDEENKWINIPYPTILEEGDTAAHLTNGFGISTLDYNQTVAKVIEIDTTTLNNLYASNADSSLFEEYFAVIKPKKESLNLFVGENDNAYQTVDVATFIVNQETSEDFYGAYFSGSVVIRQLLLGASSLRSSIHASTSLHSYEDEENVTNIIYPLSATLNEHGYNLKIEVCKFGDTIESSSYGTIKMEYCFNRNENNITVYDSICWFVSGNLNDSMFIASPRYNTTKDSLYIPIFSRTTKLPNEFSADLSIESSFNPDIEYMASLKSNDYNKKLATWPGKKNEFTLEGTVVDTTNYTLDADKLDGQHGSYYLDNTDEQDIEYTSPLYGYNDHGLLSITNGTGASIYTFGAGIDPTYGGLVPPNNNLGSGYFLNANGDWAEVSSGFVGTATSDLNMSDYNIDNVDSLEVEEDLIVNGSILINTEKWLDQFRKQPYYYTDCWSATANFIAPFAPGALNSGTYNTGLLAEDHPGSVKFTSSTTTNSGYYITLSTASVAGLGKGEITEYIVKFIQFDSTTTYLGFIDATSSESVDGAYFHISTSGIATGKTASNSSRTSTSTTYTLSLNTWYRFKVKVSSSTRADFYIYNDSETQLWTDYVTTNIPGTSRATGGGGIVSTKTTSGTGGNKDLIQIDYISSYFGVLTR